MAYTFFLAQGQTVFWRDISFGGNQYTDAIQKQLSLGFEQADALKKGEASGEHSLEEILPILRSVSDDLAQELQNRHGIELNGITLISAVLCVIAAFTYLPGSFAELVNPTSALVSASGFEAAVVRVDHDREMIARRRVLARDHEVAQQQRLAFARVLLARPDLFVYRDWCEGGLVRENRRL